MKKPGAAAGLGIGQNGRSRGSAAPVEDRQTIIFRRIAVEQDVFGIQCSGVGDDAGKVGGNLVGVVVSRPEEPAIRRAGDQLLGAGAAMRQISARCGRQMRGLEHFPT